MLLNNIALGQAGTYCVVVTNIAGATNSCNAVVSVYSSAVPVLSGAGRTSNGLFQLSLAGVPGYKYAILASTNLSYWFGLQTNNAPFTFTDTNSGCPRCFYRAQYIP